MTTGTGFTAARPPRIMLIVITTFNLVSAIAGAIALSSGEMVRLGMPLKVLEGSIFPDFFWPGVILGVVVGGTQLVALIAYYARFDLAWGLFAVAGFGMQIWIFIETGIIRGQSALQLGYFASGLAQCVLVLLILGVWPRPFLGRTPKDRSE